MSTSASTQDRPGLPAAGTCCAPLLREPITAGQAADLARMLKALADPTRLCLVSLVAASDAGEACVCDLTQPLGLTQPTVSHHLKILVEAGIFTRDKRGVQAYYALVPQVMNALSAVLSTTSQDPRPTCPGRWPGGLQSDAEQAEPAGVRPVFAGRRGGSGTDGGREVTNGPVPADAARRTVAA